MNKLRLPRHFGAVPFDAVRPLLSQGNLQRALRAVPDARTVVCAALPYYIKSGPGNLSKYARGCDYHDVMRQRLETFCAELRECFGGQYRTAVLVDASPLPEVRAAAMAGLGRIGHNGLLITPEYGSYVFLGCILTDLALDCEAAEITGCEGCGLCAAACPGGALSLAGGRPVLDPERCVSHITQKKGALTDAQRELLGRSGSAFGCDACQDACPHNRAPAETDIPEFRENLLCSLRLCDVEGLTNRTLREKYPGRAFTWRGAEILHRNCAILEQKDP